MTRAGAIQVALLRRAGRRAEASSRLAQWRAQDPTSAILRHEAVRLGSPDPALWLHLAGDAQRVLEVAADYMGIGAWDDALLVLDHPYPSGAGVVSEPGAPSVGQHPEVAYWRGYCRERLGQSGTRRLPGRIPHADDLRVPTTRGDDGGPGPRSRRRPCGRDRARAHGGARTLQRPGDGRHRGVGAGPRAWRRGCRCSIATSASP